MPKAPFADVLSYLRTVAAVQHCRDLTDTELLGRFVTDREDAAFSVLVQRHGPMVLAVCRRVMGDAHLAEDAFQATFMVLAQRAKSIKKKGFLAGWLHAVAQRVAEKAKARQKTAAIDRRTERTSNMQHSEPLDELTLQELRSVLDEAINRLPEQYRIPIVLCYLEGKTHEQAARELGWPKTSLTNRLARARELLREQLTGRGITLTAGALAVVLTEKTAGAAVGAMLTVNTARASLAFAAGKALAGSAMSATAIALAEEAMKAAIGVKGTLCLVLLALSMGLGGAGFAGYSALTGREGDAPAVGAQTQPPIIQQGASEKQKPKVGVDIFSEPLPEGAVGRLGTQRFRAGPFTNALAFSPNGKLLASQGDYGEFEGGLWLWDAITGRSVRHISVSDIERSLAFSPDGKMLLVSGAARPTLLDVASGKVLRQFDHPSEPFASLPLLVGAFSPDGRTVAAAGGGVKGSQIFFWNVATGKLLKHLHGDAEDLLEAIAISPDGKVLAAGGKNKTICLWDVATEKVIRRLEGIEQGRILFLAFAAPGKVLASLAEDWTVRLWDAETGKMLRQLKGDMATMCNMAVSRDGRLVATGGSNGTLHLWDSQAGTELRAWQAHRTDINSLAFSPDGQVLASTGNGDCAIRRWDTNTGKEIDPPSGHTGTVKQLRFAEDGKTMLSCGRDCRVLEWDLETFRASARFFGGSMGPAEKGWSAQTLDLSSAGNLLAVLGDWWTGKSPERNSAIRFFDVVTGQETGNWKLPVTDLVDTFKFSPDGKLLVSIGSGAGTRLWDVATGKELHYIQGNEEIYHAVAFSPNSKLLAFTDAETNVGKAIRLWDIAAGKELRRWDSRQWHVQDLLFAPDGKSLVSAAMMSVGTDVEVRIWETATGTQRALLAGLKGDSDRPDVRITSMAFSRSGRILAVGVRRETWNRNSTKCFCKVHLFETISGKEIRQIDTTQGTVYSLAFSADGRTLASSGADSTILLWDLTGQATTGKSKPVPPTTKEVKEYWAELAAEAPQADGAIWALALAPKQSLPLLKEQMVVRPAPAEQVAKLITDLDSDTFTKRQQAAKALDDLGEAAEGAVRHALAGNPALELRQRLEQLMQKRNVEVIRKLRAIEVLEQIGTAEARELLDSLAKGSPNPRVLDAAKAALARQAK